MKQSENGTTIVHKMEFLLQSAVLQMDDELIGWVSKFAECLASNLGANLTGVHQIFKREEGPRGQVRHDPTGRATIARPGEGGASDAQRELPGSSLVDPDQPDSLMAFESTAQQTPLLLARGKAGAQLSQRPEKKQGVRFGYSAFASEHGQAHLFAQISPDSWLNYDIEARANPVFIKELVMSPIDFEITFRTRGKTENEVATDETGSVLRGLKQLGLSLSNVDKAPFRLNSLVITNVYGTPGEINTVLYAHYRHRLMKNVLGLFLSTAALGNMNLLAQDLGTGVKDFFYRPAEGFVDGPIEGGKGLVFGTASLLGHTAKGAFGSVSRIVNTVSKSLLFLAGDEDFIDRREQEALDQPDNVLQGLALGLKSTLTGVASGVAGIYQQPVKGARKSGVRGFVTGTLKGLGGAVVKPLSGGLDLLMKTSEGVHNMVKVGGRGKKKEGGQVGSEEPASPGQEGAAREEAKREDAWSNTAGPESAGHLYILAEGQALSKIRPFRPLYGRNQRLKPFHAFQAVVALNLKSICKGAYAGDHFLDAIGYANGDLRLCVILTEERVLIVDAIDRSLVKDFPTEVLCSVEGRPLYHKTEVSVLDLGEIRKEEAVPSSYEIVLRVYETLQPTN